MTNQQRQRMVITAIKDALPNRMGAPVSITQIDSYTDKDLFDWKKDYPHDEYDGVQLAFKVETDTVHGALTRGAVYKHCLPVMFQIRHGCYWSKVDCEFDDDWPEGIPDEYDACWHLDSIDSTADPTGYYVKLTVEHCYCS